MNRTPGGGHVAPAILAAQRRLLANAPGGLSLLAGVVPVVLVVGEPMTAGGLLLAAAIPLLYLGWGMAFTASWIRCRELPAEARLRSAALHALAGAVPVGLSLVAIVFFLFVAPPFALAVWAAITFFALPAGPSGWKPAEAGFSAAPRLALEPDIRLLAMLPTMALIGLPLAVGPAPPRQGPAFDMLWLGWWAFTLLWALYSSAALSAHFSDHEACMQENA